MNVAVQTWPLALYFLHSRYQFQSMSSTHTTRIVVIGVGAGRSLLAQALRDCYDAGRTFAFIAVILDCIDDAAKAFYRHFDFAELPGHPYRLFLTAARLEAMMTGS